MKPMRVVSNRDWRYVAYYRNVPAVTSRGELRQCLKEQMTPSERLQYHIEAFVGWMIILGVGFAFYWCDHAISGLLAMFFIGLAVYFWVDPVEKASREMNEAFARELHEVNLREREKRASRETSGYEFTGGVDDSA